MHLSPKDLRRFFSGIVIPSILAIILFIASMYIFIIPSFENNIMNKKREMIRELVNTTWNLVEDFNQDYKEGLLSLEEAQQHAMNKIESIRYGDENKDYFWIIDLYPRMIMHPYRIDLNGTELTNYKDQAGKALFVVAVDTVQKSGEGFIDYMWQWKDDSTKIVPKLSYVKLYKEWNWIIGTGIYIEDVKEEISSLENRLLKIAFIIIGIISIIILYIIKQSLDIERRRKDIQDKLKASRRKYQSLVEASIDGTLLVVDDKIIFSNITFNNMYGSSASYVLLQKFDDIFEIKWNNVLLKVKEAGKSVSIDTRIKTANKTYRDVVLSISKAFFGKQAGYIIIVKDLNQVKLVEKETEQLSNEVQTSLLLMNQPIQHFSKEIISCEINSSIANAVQIMTRKNSDVIFVSQDSNLIGIITDHDLKTRVLATQRDISSSVSNIMTAPIIAVNENILLYEAILQFNNRKISHLAVTNSEGKISGVISNYDIFEMQRNSISFLVREVEHAETVHQIEKITQRLPVLIKALIDSGARTQNITRIITSLTDAITKRLIALAIEKIGNPPSGFAFIAVGSEGRMEQTLATDQDNAIIIENVHQENLDVFKRYFLELGSRISDSLNDLGFKYCNGKVMASNPRWVLSLDEWKKQFHTWIVNSDPKSIMEAGIFFDFRCIYGSQELTKELQNYIFQISANKAAFFQHLANPIIKYKSAINLFGNIVGDTKEDNQNVLDIKKIIFPITSFIRIYAIRNKIEETNSLLRLEKLNSINQVKKNLYNEINVSYNYLMLMRFRFQTNQLLKKKDPDNLVNIDELTDIEKTTLKKIISEISNLQTQLNFDFKGNL
ncbi:MAG: cache domain-containing protein [Bacteroidetes bacterium]|nr:cache domain-containing protein [Bacteroidota bacterium]